MLPELVHTRADGFKSLDYGRMCAVLVEAMNELLSEQAALRSEVRALREACQTPGETDRPS